LAKGIVHTAIGPRKPSDSPGKKGAPAQQPPKQSKTVKNPKKM